MYVFGMNSKHVQSGSSLTSKPNVINAQGLRNIISLIIHSLASMLNVTLLLCMFVGIFAILGVQLFSGLMYRCNDPTVSGEEECTGTYFDETSAEVPRVWNRPFLNFDHLGRALLTLFVCSTLV